MACDPSPDGSSKPRPSVLHNSLLQDTFWTDQRSLSQPCCTLDVLIGHSHMLSACLLIYPLYPLFCCLLKMTDQPLPLNSPTTVTFTMTRDPPTMQVQPDQKVRAATEANISLRCVYKAEFTLKSYHSSDVFPWARSLCEEFTTALLQQVKKLIENASIQLNIIRIEYPSPHALICFDLFLHPCDEQTKSQI